MASRLLMSIDKLSKGYNGVLKFKQFQTLAPISQSRFISNSQKKADTDLATPKRGDVTTGSFYEKKWHDVDFQDDKRFCYGFDQDSPEDDRFIAEVVAIFVVLFTFGIFFFFNYNPYKNYVPWSKREALLLLAEREEHDIPPVPKYYVDPLKLKDHLPAWEVLTEWEQKMLMYDFEKFLNEYYVTKK